MGCFVHFLCDVFPAGNCQRRTLTSTIRWRRRALRKRGSVATTTSFCGVCRPAPSFPLPPPLCTAPSPPPRSPHPLSFPPHRSQGVTLPPTATAVSSRLNTAPHPTEPIKISPLDQGHPLTGQRPIRITPLARPRPHTECHPIAVTQPLASALFRDKLTCLYLISLLFP